MIRTRIALVWLLLTVLSFSVEAQIKGFRTQKFPEEGFSLKVPKRWDQIPPQPDETDVVARWALDTMKKGTGDTYTLEILKFRPRTGTTGGQKKPREERPAGGEGGEAKFDREEFMKRWRERNRPVSFTDYWKKSMSRQKLPDAKAFKLGKSPGKLYEVNTSGARWAYSSYVIGTVKDSSYEWAIVYTVPTEEVFPKKNPKKKTRLKANIHTSIKSFKLFTPVRKSQPNDVDLDKISEIDKKILEVKRRLPKSWKVIPTPEKQYVVVHNIPQKKTRQITFASNILKYLERMRAHYEKEFPPRKPVTDVLVVRVCQDREEYFQYGGPGGSAGYFSPMSKELVIYDASKEGGMADSYSTLFHEAYHQYLYFAVGQVSAHRWFDEGYGDYFAGANPKRGFKIEPFDWRTGTVKKAVAEGKNVHLKDLFVYTQPQYYRNASVCYSQGWALVYFLKSKAAARGNEAWPKILERYFNTLVKTRSSSKALKAALKDIDLEALNKAYVEFIQRNFK